MDSYIISILLSLILIFSIPLIIIFVVYIVGLWKLFKKAGYQGWEAIVPLYNSWILVKISGLNSWYYLLFLANVITYLLNESSLILIGNLASLVASFFIYYNICKKFHKDIFFVVLMLLFPGIMIPILGLKKSNIYDNTVKVSPNGPIGDSEINSNNNYSGSNNFCRYCGNKLENNINFCPSCGSKVNEN